MPRWSSLLLVSSPITTPPLTGGSRRLRPLSLSPELLQTRPLSALIHTHQHNTHTLSASMLALVAAGSVFFPGLFLVSKHALKRPMGWSEGDAVVLSTR